MNSNKMLVSKNLIDKLKNDSSSFHSFLQEQNEGVIVRLLEKIGRLENNYSKEPLVSLLNNRNENIRSLAVKNLAKLADISLLPTFIKIARSDESTIVRREAVSALGRLRNQRAIPALIEFLGDPDPKVVMQAIRGLIVFGYRKDVKDEIKKLVNHPNEMIKEVINQEVNGIRNSYQTSTQSHDKFPEFLKNTVVLGDVQEILKHVPDESVHLTFTSPPYCNSLVC